MHRSGLWAKLPQLLGKPDLRADVELVEIRVDHAVALKIDPS